MEKGSIDSRCSVSVLRKRFSVVQPEVVIRREAASHRRFPSAASTSDEANVAERRLQFLRPNGKSLHGRHRCATIKATV
jgi:hypothetical protein